MNRKMALDEILLKELARGPATVKQITARLERLARDRLDRLRVRGMVIREGKGGRHRQYVFKLPAQPIRQVNMHTNAPRADNRKRMPV